MKVSENMTEDVYYLHIDADIQQAHDLMATLHCRHIPVAYEGNIVGMVSDRDILLHAKLEYGELVLPKMKITEIMKKDIQVCWSDQHISDVAKHMVEQRVDSLPVFDRERNMLISIITTTDLLNMLAKINDLDKHDFSSVSVALETLLKV
ncbi:MAG TPA: hypothetical protein DCE42_29565 [Myxococcales bacterium]|nr:hypothetical protein [Myxococcales bacterium]